MIELKVISMTYILIVTSRKKNFAEFMDALTRDGTVEEVRTVSAKAAMESLSAAQPDLVVIDEEVDGTPGLEIAKSILMKNAMVNQALVSEMGPEEFHDTTEGLGIMAQLPPGPDAGQAEILLKILAKMP